MNLRPAWIEVDGEAILHNVQWIRQILRSHTRLMAVVKANAYGHGLVPTAQILLEAGVDALGVACLEEALELKGAGVNVPIILLGPSLPDQAEEIVHHQIQCVVSDGQMVRALSKFAQRWEKPAEVHLKVDTGMTRQGALVDRVPELLDDIIYSPGVHLKGICTHFASADSDPEYTEYQFQQFKKVISWFKEDPSPPLFHCANSSATLLSPQFHLDMVRCGLLVYGINPFYKAPTKGYLHPNLRPALSLKARIALVKEVPAGQKVGYGCTYTTRRPTRIALVPLGYGDGLPWQLSNRGNVLLRGQRAPILGRVSMDQFTVDVTDIPGVQVGDEVVLLGPQGQEEQTVHHLAEDAGLIPHVVLANLGARLRRSYLLPQKPSEEESPRQVQAVSPL